MYKKAYGLFREHLATGKIEGYIERSFSMDWSTEFVRAEWKNEYSASDLKRYLTNAKGFPRGKGYRYFIVRISGKNPDIQVNLEKGHDKFSRRNKRFTVKKLDAVPKSS